MTNSEIRQMTTQEIVEQLKDAKASLAKLKINHRVSDLENPHIITETKRLIARYKTELKAREISEAKQ